MKTDTSIFNPFLATSEEFGVWLDTTDEGRAFLLSLQDASARATQHITELQERRRVPWDHLHTPIEI